MAEAKERRAAKGRKLWLCSACIGKMLWGYRIRCTEGRIRQETCKNCGKKTIVMECEVEKVADGVPLGGRSRAEDDFDDDYEGDEDFSDLD